MGNHISQNPLFYPLEHRGEEPEPTPPPPEPITVAVVGGGMVGVHVAKEFAQRGMDVTVYERNDDVGLGATRFDTGVIGGPYTPCNYDREWVKEMLLGMFPYNDRMVITRENPWTMPLNFVDTRWAWHRFKLIRRKRLTRERVVDAGNWLALETEAEVHKMLYDIPSLQSAVTSGTTYNLLNNKQWKPHQLDRSGDDVRPARQLVVDPTKWTQLLAEHLKKKYDVKFKYLTHVSGLQREYKWEHEFVSTVVSVSKDPETNEQSKPRGKEYDIVVVATGHRAQETTWYGYPLPVLPVATYGLMFTADHPKYGQLIHPEDELAHKTQLIEKAGIQAFRAHPSMMQDISQQTRATSVAPWWMLSGLLSLDTAAGQPEERYSKWYVSHLFRTRMRTHKGLDLPQLENEDPSVHVVRYVKDVTPDGLPIISRVGQFANCFSCVGVGDDVSRWAAGSAALLGRIIDKTAEDSLQNPFSAKRFEQFKEIPEPTDGVQTLVTKYDQADEWLNDIGAPFYEGVWQWCRETPLLDYLPEKVQNMFGTKFEKRASIPFFS